MRRSIRCLMRTILARIFEEHQKQHYIYTLKEAARADDQISVLLGQGYAGDIETLEKWIGESQIEMLYDSADAEVLGFGLSGQAKHEIFLEYLERKAAPERLRGAGR